VSTPKRKATGQRRAVASQKRLQAQLSRKATKAKYVLRLYVTGISPTSERSLRRLKQICEEHLKGRYDLDVIDIYQRPALARDEQIIATPTLIKVLPAPIRRFVGDLSDAQLLFGLDLRKQSP
jgi:circadian clock protein KaiB